ncbi:MAG TPA: PDZ domain-containing protein [Thermoanaerobaculia bacterium]|nr:PDZ domain-containing protein [Thermoanaerobaculia bacterium]
MKTRLLALALLLTALPLLAQTPVPRSRTVVIRDGKVVSGSPEGIEFLEVLGGKRAYLGVTLVDLTSDLREHYGAPKSSGVLVGSVEDGSPADKAGVRVGDMILTVDGEEIDSSIDLRRALREKKDGDSVRLEVMRGKSRQTLVASVVEKEGPRVLAGPELDGLRERLNSPEWRARVQSFGDCGELQTRIKDLESRLKDLEKKLQK